MNGELPLTVTVDNSDGLRYTADDPRAYRRTIRLYIDPYGDYGYRVTALGDPFPEDGGSHTGVLPSPLSDLHAAVETLRTTWVKRFLDYQDADDIRAQRHPFNDNVDLSGASREAHDTSLRLLARAGHTVFQLLFYEGDEGLADIGDRLAAALREQSHVVTVHSEDLFVPWPMLYVSPDPNTDLDLDDAKWSYRGFWGYRHLVEHSFKRIRGWSARLPIRGRVKVGLNVDRHLDEQYPNAPTVKPVIELLQGLADTIIRERRADLARAIKAPDFADQLIYFGCHGTVSGDPTRGITQPGLLLTDREPIHTSDFQSWLRKRPLTHNPVVFVNACQGGQLSSMFFTAFGRIMLDRGANCMIGPQIDVPPAFAKEYACQFFAKMMEPGTRIGDVSHQVTRHFIDECANPLGLTYSLYRGLDSYFARA
jgi:hypothetical protein